MKICCRQLGLVLRQGEERFRPPSMRAGPDRVTRYWLSNTFLI